MYRWIKGCNLPVWVKILINILITVTVIYWLGLIIYKILDVIRLFLHTISERKVWWISLVLLSACTITTLCILEILTDIKPFTCFRDWIISLCNNARDTIAGVIKSK